jgi:hypothetical protein
MLIANVGQEVGSVDVVPNPGIGDVVGWYQGFPDMGFEILRKGKAARTVGVSESWFGAYVAEHGCCCKELHY